MFQWKDAASDPSGMPALLGRLPRRERWGTFLEPPLLLLPQASLLCSEFSGLRVSGLEGSVVQCGPQIPSSTLLPSSPATQGVGDIWCSGLSGSFLI